MASNSTDIPSYIKFICASISGVAGTLVCFPLDLLKLNMQVAGAGGAKREHTTMVGFAKHIIQRDGFKGMYAGLSASIVRQASYTGVRLGTFQIFVDYFTENGKPPGILTKCACGALAGALGGVSGLPPDVVLTRMAVDKSVAAEKRRNYKNVFDGMSRIVKEEGGSTLFRGIGPTIVRAMVVNVSQFVSYVQAKEFLVGRKIMAEDSLCHFVCSVFSAFIATTAALPPDMAKTRMQNMSVVNGVPEYKSMMDVFMKIVQKEGPFALWKGFTPLFLRNGPQFVILFLVYEETIAQYKKLHGLK